VLDIGPRTCPNIARGLLGVAADPRFGTEGNDFVYLYYTHEEYQNRCPAGDPTNRRNPVNRVSRFAVSGDGSVGPASEQVLVDNIPDPSINHQGGDLQFGKDGNLYISEGGCDYAERNRCQYENDASRDRHVLLGDEAVVGPEDAANDYGWNVCEGNYDNPYRSGRSDCSGSRFTGPGHEYNHATGCESLTGGAFVPDGAFSAEYDGSYLFGDFVCGRIFELEPDGVGGYVARSSPPGSDPAVPSLLTSARGHQKSGGAEDDRRKPTALRWSVRGALVRRRGKFCIVPDETT
jgi:hypothetical protein